MAETKHTTVPVSEDDVRRVVAELFTTEDGTMGNVLVLLQRLGYRNMGSWTEEQMVARICQVLGIEREGK
jgi:hypothetical protein